MAHNGRHHCGANQATAKAKKSLRHKENAYKRKMAYFEKEKENRERWAKDIKYQKKQQAHYADFASFSKQYQNRYNKHVERYGTLI